MNKQVLVTGFEGFRTRSHNPTSEVLLPAVQEAYGDQVITTTLPVVHDRAAAQLHDLLETTRPAAVVLFGVAAGRKIRLEQRARNWRSSIVVADNNGTRHFGRLQPGGPVHLPSSLPLEAINSALDDEAIPNRLSRSAGLFLCNEVMYHALNHAGIAASEQVPTGFIHVGSGMPDESIRRAGIASVGAVITHISQ